MGIETKKKIPLPAPTESIVDDDPPDSPDPPIEEDLATDLSRRTDHTSYEIPEDGTPLTISTKRIRATKSAGDSQTSLLIEYFAAGEGKQGSRPSVRVKVTPHGQNKTRSPDSVKITEFGKDQKPSYTRRISLAGPSSSKKAIKASEASSTLSENSPVEVELFNNRSDISSLSAPRFIPTESDVSSMPDESVLAGPITIKEPSKQRQESPRPESPVSDLPPPPSASTSKRSKMADVSLKAPDRPSDRSASRERIARRVMDKLIEEHQDEPLKVAKRRPASSDSRADDVKSRRSSNHSSSRDYDDARLSAAESSYLRPRDADSNISGVSSGVSISNNPKLIRAVEDVVKRLILPEIQDLKRQQSTRSSRYDRNSFVSDSDFSRSELTRDLSVRHSAPVMKPKLTLSREDRETGTTISEDSERRHAKGRRSSRDSRDSDKLSSSRRSSVDSVALEKDRIHKAKEAAAIAGGAGLTAAALRSHNSRSSVDSRDSRDREQREKRKKRSKSRARSESVATEEEHRARNREIPPLPMASEIADSDLTRTSILSAETESTEQHDDSPRHQNLQTAVVHEVSRGSPRSIPLPESRPATRTPLTERDVAGTPSSLKGLRSRSDLALHNVKSDRSLSSKARIAALAAAGLGGAGAALYGHDRVRSSEKLREPARDVSRGNSPGSSGKKTPSVTNTAKDHVASREEKQHDAKDSPVAQVQPLHVAKKVEHDTDLQPTVEDAPPSDENSLHYGSEREYAEQDDDFFDRQSQINDRYRHSGEFDNADFYSQAHTASKPFQHTRAADSIGDAYGRAAAGRNVQTVAANPDVHTPSTVESNVASLVDPSTVESSHSFQSSESPHRIPRKQVSQDHDPISAERWNALRGQAQRLSEDTATRSMKSEDSLALGASGMPDPNHPMPDFALGMDDGFDSATNPSIREKTSSIVEGPMDGGQHESRDHWPYEATPPVNRREGYVDSNHHDEHFLSQGNAALMGAAAGLGIGGAAAAVGKRSFGSDGNVHQRQSPIRGPRSQPSSSAERLPHMQNRDLQNSRDGFHLQETVTPSSTRSFKDEGYLTAATIPPARSPDAPTPLSFSKPPPLLWDKRDLGDTGTTNTPIAQMEDPFASRNVHARNISEDTRTNEATPMYDAATGQGINNIQSKDVVALMDHLTVRDGQRNARDTEILVTLVRSAAEMKNSFDDMKRFIEYQNVTAGQRSDAAAQQTISKILSNKTNSALNFRSSKGESDPPKKKNIFQRALKGLSSKNSSDIERIEDMLMQILEEMEVLRLQNGFAASPMSQRQGPPLPPPVAESTPARSLDSYERLRAAPESGYEPSGRAGTATSQSGNLTPTPPHNQAQRMHSGYDLSRGPAEGGTRISTVLENDEEYDHGRDSYENDDGMLTPTQEAQQQRLDPYKTPNSKSAPFAQTPKTGGERSSRHKSTNSSIFPKVSRWSKTTTSSEPRESFHRDGAYSDASMSGSQINVLPDQGYVPNGDDRLRSADSLLKDGHARSPSPLIPEDPKYRANRHTLEMQYPVPRPGQGPGYQSHLESQATALAKLNGLDNSSPSSDTFGSVPSWSRFARQSFPNNNATQRNTVSSIDDDAYSAHSGEDNIHQAHLRQGFSSGPPRPPKIRDEGPLVPSTTSSGMPLSSNPVVPPKITLDRRSYDGESDIISDGESFVSGAAPTQQQPASSSQKSLRQAQAPPREEEEETEGLEFDGEPWIEPIPLDRRRSPYLPGGVLASIEERYSLEGSVRRSDSNRHTTYEEDEDDDDYMMVDDDRSHTPVAAAPAKALGAPALDSPTARKITGPREMPPAQQARRLGAPGAAQNARAGALRGTVRRKPNPWE